MAETKHRVDQIIDDIKGSWYFRFWMLVWVVCFIMFWVTMGVFGAKSNMAREEPAWRVWIENDTKSGLEYPPFYFKLQWDELAAKEEIISATCSNQNGMSIMPRACPGIPNTKTCVEFQTNSEATSRHSRIKCYLLTNANRTEDRMILFGTDQQHNATWGDKWDLYMWPNANAHIALQRTAVKRDAKGAKEFDFWTKELTYHSSVFTANQYNVTIEFRSVDTLHFQQYDYYNGWMAVSDIGGFAFFMSILLAVVMVAVGCIFDNDSKFLNKRNDNM
jgi:hypothetical protein